MTINEIINDYTSGKTPVEETNAALKAAGAGYHFEPGQNALTEEEIRSSVGGPRPQDADGYGILDDGIGPQKCQVRDGVLVGGAVNQVNADGSTSMTVYVHIGGYTWEVYGDKLGEPEAEEAPWWAPYHTFVGAVSWQDELPRYIPDSGMMFDRPRYRDCEVIKGGLRYIYDADGKCKYQPKSMRDYDRDHGRV